MSLTTQEWRYVGSATVGAATVHACLEALYSLGTSATYYDATSRTEGAGSAWTWTGRRFQDGGATECLYPIPPTDPTGQCVLFAGSATSKTPTMASPDTFTTAMVISNVVKDPGAYNAWDNAAPMTSGTAFGYWRNVAAANPAKVHLFESQEVLLVAWETGAGTMYVGLHGAWLDPESADTTYDAESNGKLYGQAVSGATAVWGVASWNSVVTGRWLNYNGSSGREHAGVFTPGGSAILLGNMLMECLAATNTTGFGKTRSGKQAMMPLTIRGAASQPNDVFLGRVREVYITSDSQGVTPVESAGSPVGYVVGSNSASVQIAAYLKH